MNAVRLAGLGGRLVWKTELNERAVVETRVWCWGCGAHRTGSDPDCLLWVLVIARLRASRCPGPDVFCETFPAFLCPSCGSTVASAIG